MQDEKYNVVNGTAYDKETSQEVIDVLERVRKNAIRIKICYGDRITGRDWEETFGVSGYIGRSTGNFKIPLMVYNKRCLGGGALLDNCIVQIRYANKKEGGVLYQHSNYHKESLAENGLNPISI